MGYTISEFDEIHSPNEHIVSASNGNISLTSLGIDSVLSLTSQSIIMNTSNAFLNCAYGVAGGTISLSASGEESCIDISTPSAGVFASISVTPKGISILSGVDASPCAINMCAESLNLQMGPSGTGSLITMTPESITFKVGETIMTMTAEGIVTTTPSVEVNCEDTNIIISAEGITEEVGENTREVTAEGHNFTAAETELNIGVSGITAESPMGTMEFEATAEINSAMITEAADAMLSIDSGISMVE